MLAVCAFTHVLSGYPLILLQFLSFLSCYKYDQHKAVMAGHGALTYFITSYKL